MRKAISLAQVKQDHKIECPEVSLDFFMEHYCKNILREEKIEAVEVIVSPRFKFVFSKSDLQT